MIETTLATGTKGLLIVQDLTDGPSKVVNVLMQCTTSIDIPQLPWAVSIDDVRSEWRSIHFQNSVLRQTVGTVYVGNAETFTLHLGATGTVQMGGPTDLMVDLNQHGVRLVNMLVDGVWRAVLPYVNVGGNPDAIPPVPGIWKPASPFVMKDGTWQEAT